MAIKQHTDPTTKGNGRPATDVVIPFPEPEAARACKFLRKQALEMDNPGYAELADHCQAEGRVPTTQEVAQETVKKFIQKRGIPKGKSHRDHSVVTSILRIANENVRGARSPGECP